MRKEPFDAGNPDQVKERKTKAQLQKEKELEELKVLLSQRPFRDWVWRLLERTKMFHTLSVYDEHGMSIHSGQRDVGLWIFSDILEADPQAYIRMVQEKDD